MKQYPTIAGDVRPDVDIYMFDKLDGSNIRAEWSPKRGFYKFGSRKQLIDENHFLGESISLIKRDHEKVLGEIFKKERFEKATCYFEFHGPKSFAGDHAKDEPHVCTLLDVEVYKKGFMAPKDFLKAFQGQVPIPAMLYHGKANQEIVAQIRNGTFPGMTFEGVVCKAAAYKQWTLPVMFKIKNIKWLDKVFEIHGHDRRLLEEKL